MSQFVVNASQSCILHEYGQMRGVTSWLPPRRETLGALWLPAPSSLSLSVSPPEISRISTLRDVLSRLRPPNGYARLSVCQCHVVLRLGLPFLTAELRGSLSPAGRINKVPSPHWIRDGKWDLTRRARIEGGDLQPG